MSSEVRHQDGDGARNAAAGQPVDRGMERDRQDAPHDDGLQLVQQPQSKQNGKGGSKPAPAVRPSGSSRNATRSREEVGRSPDHPAIRPLSDYGGTPRTWSRWVQVALTVVRSEGSSPRLGRRVLDGPGQRVAGDLLPARPPDRESASGPGTPCRPSPPEISRSGPGSPCRPPPALSDRRRRR
jgi:hypothetical protein